MLDPKLAVSLQEMPIARPVGAHCASYHVILTAPPPPGEKHMCIYLHVFVYAPGACGVPKDSILTLKDQHASQSVLSRLMILQLGWLITLRRVVSVYMNGQNSQISTPIVRACHVRSLTGCAL